MSISSLYIQDLKNGFVKSNQGHSERGLHYDGRIFMWLHTYCTIN